MDVGEHSRDDRCPVSINAVLAALVFLGLESTLSQVYLTREALAVLEGNELILALLLSVWLIGVALGAWFSRLLARIGKRLHTLHTFLIPPVSLGIAVTILRVSHGLFERLPGQPLTPLQTLITIVVAVIPVAGGCGAIFPMLTGLVAAESGRAVGRAFAWDALGSVVAGALLSFLLLPVLTPFWAVHGLLVLTIGLLITTARTKRWPLSVVGFLVGIAILSGFPRWLETETSAARWRVKHPELERVASLESRYQHLDLSYQKEQWTIFGNGLPLFSFPDDYSLAPFVHLSLSQCPRPRSVLLLSDRGWWLIPYLREHGIERIVCCTMDPAIERLADSVPEIQLPPLRAEETIVFSDPRAYVGSLPSTESFDCILIDQPDPATALLNRIYTLEWYRMVSEHLSDGGVFVFSVTGTPVATEADTGQFGASLYETLSNVFADVLLVPAQSWTFFASNTNGLLHDDLHTVLDRWKQAEVNIPTFPSEMLSLYYQPSMIENLTRQIHAIENVPLNTDARPYVYAAQLSLWLRRAGVDVSIEWYIGVLSVLVVSLSVLCIGVMVWKKQSLTSSPWPAAWMLGASGALTMGVEWVLLVIYQSRIGCLYQTVGLFFSVFMLGLALGGFAGLRIVKAHNRSALPWLIGIDLILIAIALTTPFVELLVPASGSWLAVGVVLLWLAFTSVVAGIQFPILSHYLSTSTPDTVRLASLLEGVDHAGGAIGAPVVALAILPWFGLVWTCVVLAVIKIVVLAVFLTTRPTDRSTLPG